ncbi:MAG: CAP domain-containing protein [Oscillospiraceae bacterium]|nr:CAP domain-containing protein [Oscillospiraceae bacterium]
MKISLKKLSAIILAAALLLAPVYAAHAETYNIDTGSGIERFAFTNRADFAREVFRLTNEHRRQNGLSTLSWSSSLAGPSMQRAAEASVVAQGGTRGNNSRHIRPSGQPWDTVLASSLKSGLSAWGENLAGGYLLSPRDVVEAWIASPGHNANMLNPRYNSMAAGCVEISPNEYHWTQHFARFNDPGAFADEDDEPANTGSAAGARSSGASPVSQSAVVDATRKAVAAAAAGRTAVVGMRNGSAISLETMKAMSAAAGNTPVRLNMDSMTSTGALDVRVSINPARATKSIDLSASTLSEGARKTDERFRRFYKNDIAVISLGQKGDFGMAAAFALKVGIKTDNLVFYTYDAEKNTRALLRSVTYRVDDKGYVHFSTPRAGDIVISDGVLRR